MSSDTSQLDRYIGLVLDQQFELTGVLGKGGMGAVFAAQDHRLGRPVAIKIIRPRRAAKTRNVEAFLAEARTIANLEHQHILTVHGLGIAPIDGRDTFFMAMQFAAGGSLADRIFGGGIAARDVVPLVRQVAEALDYAHGKGVIHLDLKPLNILLDSHEHARVADFGLAKLLAPGASRASGNGGAGTLVYMPPEQEDGGDVGPFSDIFALGVTTHELLTGGLPERQGRRGNRRLVLNAGLSPGVAEVLRRATHPDGRQRYATAGAMAAALSTAIFPTVSPIAQPAPPAPSRPPTSPPLPARRTFDPAAVRVALRAFGDHCAANPDLTESEVVAFAMKPNGLLQALGYDSPGEDVLLERQEADVVLRAFTGRPLAVIEFKRPQRQVTEGLRQLEERYVERLLPDVGALCNGHELWIYRRGTHGLIHPPVLSLTLSQATEADARAVHEWLGRRALDLTDLDAFGRVLRDVGVAPIPVRGPGDAGGQAFLERFALRPSTPFGRLVASMAAALPGMLEASSFTQGAFAFWKRFYARELKSNRIPTAWRLLMPVGSPDEALPRLMFALESAYAVMSRLLLARTMENHRFPGVDLSETLLGALQPERRIGRLPTTAYAAGVRSLFRFAGGQAFQSIFASDIFDWWHDLHLAPGAAPVGERLAEIALAIFEFDFQPMTGDLLGSLYQSYFDPDTRKALGEFYTPPGVVDFILDQVGYTADASQLTSSRLLDPACGSGTFLIHALQRYLSAAQGRPPAEVLKTLLGGLKIVGFDINPFAVLMAQANYAAQLVPLYAQALAAGELPPTLSIPVLRTDSLRQEYREGEQPTARLRGGVQLRLDVEQDEQVTSIRTELPVEVAPGEFFRVEIPVPRFDTARGRGWVDNPEQYFAALRVLFDAVADERSGLPALRERLVRAGLQDAARELAEYLRPAAARLIATMRHLREQYNDGRFLKTLADLALALVLKGDVRYDYVVGNPPYIRIQAIPQALRQNWEGWYGWASGNFDAYIPFMERALHLAPRPTGPNLEAWLAPGGKLGFICPNRFLLANYADNLRRSLPEHAAVELLFDFRAGRVFEDALNYPAIVVARRLDEGEEPPATLPAIRVFADPGQGVGPMLDEARRLLHALGSGQSHVSGTIADAFHVDRDVLRDGPWLLMPRDERAIFDQIEAATEVTEMECPVCRHFPAALRHAHPHVLRLQHLTMTQNGGFQGLKTGLDNVMVFRLVADRGDTLLLRPKGAGTTGWAGPAEVEIERAVLRPWLFGPDVERWHIARDGWYVFFPYALITALEVQGQARMPVTRDRLIPSTQAATLFARQNHYQAPFPLLDRDYPLAWAYLTHPAIESRLRGRENGRYAEGMRWYELARPQNLEHFEAEKYSCRLRRNGPTPLWIPNELFSRAPASMAFARQRALAHSHSPAC